MSSATYIPAAQVIDPDVMPFSGALAEALDGLWLGPVAVGPDGAEVGLALEQELVLRVPGFDFIDLAVGSSGTVIDFSLSASFAPTPKLAVSVPITLRIDAEILRPVKPLTQEPDTDAKTLNVSLGTVNISLDGDGNLDLGLGDGVQIPRCMVGTSGVIIQGKLRWLTPASVDLPTPLPPNFTTGIYLDDVEAEVVGLSAKLRMDDIFIGTGGFSGKIALQEVSTSPLTWNAAQKRFAGGVASGELFGFQCGLKRVNIVFVQNALTESSLLAELFLPYVDKRIGVDMKLSLAGDLRVGLAAPQASIPDSGVKLENGLLRVTKEGVVDATLESVAFEKRADDVAVRLEGTIRPLFAGVQWPEVGLKALTIHADGRVETGGQWLDLPQQKATNLHGFPLEIRKVGFGSEGSRRWIGFSGGIKLVDGIPVGGSVEGLRILWDPKNPADFNIDLKGIQVDLNIPDVITLNGSVAFFENPAKTKQWFEGVAKVWLWALNCTLDGRLLVGRTPEYTFFYVFLEAGLPAGIPLFSTGLAVYGIGGLFGYNVKPDRRDGEPWYDGWYKRDPIGPTSARKWTDSVNRQAFGGSVTLGTLPDNGFTVSARALVIVIIPGPLVLVEGKANLLKDRSALGDPKVDPLFRALAVLDGEAGTFLLNVEPRYVFPEQGPYKGFLIDIGGMAEAFFDFNHSDRWYLNLGLREPREKRLHAALVQIFQANAYFMLNQQRLALGAFVGYDERFVFGPISLRLAMWFEGDAEIVFRPLQLDAGVGLHGRAELKIFGFGLGVELDAVAELRTATPFEIQATVHAKADLPWPLPDPEVTIPLEYIERAPPPLPVPLQNIEVVTRKGSESWDTGGPSNPLLVPLDGKPVLVFSKSMHDNPGVAGNFQPAESELAADIAFDYHLDSITLEKKVQSNPDVWQANAGRPRPPGGVDLYGMWMPMTTLGETPQSTKLMLFVKTPFDATRNAATNSAAEEFARRYPEYPCVLTCVGFENAPEGVIPGLFAHKELAISYAFTHVPPAIHNPRGTTGGGHHFPWPQGRTFYVPDFKSESVSLSFPEPVEWVRLRFSTGSQVIITPFTGGQKQTSGGTTFYTGGQAGTPETFTRTVGIRDFEVELEKRGITRIELEGSSEFDLFQVCYVTVATAAAATPGTSSHNVSEAKRWADDEFLLEPDSTYRLLVGTRVTAAPSLKPAGFPVQLDGPLAPTAAPGPSGAPEYGFNHEVYLRTEGPPGFLGSEIDRRVAGGVSMPPDAGTPNKPQSLVRTLRPYVARSVPEDGERPVYRAYDVAVEFNESYVKRMYEMHGNRSLKLKLLDRNGDPPRERSGGTPSSPLWRNAVVGASWGKKGTATLTREDQQWLNLLSLAACKIRPPVAGKPKDDILNVNVTGALLSPEMTYSATLEPDPATGVADADKDLFAFSFTTSKFATFAHHVHSFDGRLRDLDQGRDSPLPALSATDQAVVRAAAQSGKPEDFEAIARLLQLSRRPLPERLEVTLLRDAQTKWGFLIESPEPMDAERVAAGVRWTADPALLATHRGAVRLRDAAFGDRSGSAFNDEWIDLLVTEAGELPSVVVDHLQTPSDPVTFAPLHTFTGTGRFQPGTVIRLHAGAPPTSPPSGDGIQHVYRTAAGGAANWMLHAARDVLRLRDVQEGVLSKHEFFALFGRLDVFWIWNADRTRAFALLAAVVGGASGATVAAGTYRFEWRFDLDLSATDQAAPVLRRQGSAAPEEAVTQFSVL